MIEYEKQAVRNSTIRYVPRSPIRSAHPINDFFRLTLKHGVEMLKDIDIFV